jgi:hypothetical protein
LHSGQHIDAQGQIKGDAPQTDTLGSELLPSRFGVRRASNC